MATYIRSINGEKAVTTQVRVTLPVEVLEHVLESYPHMSHSAAVRAALTDEYAAFVASLKKGVR